MSAKIAKVIVCKNDEYWEYVDLKDNLVKYNSKIEKASPSYIFDYYIKKSFLNNSPYMTGNYITDTKKDFGRNKPYKGKNHFYDRYLTKDIENHISPVVLECYKGKGNEFNNGKIYCVGSSSRFVISSFTDNNAGKLESIKKLLINNKKEKLVIDFEHSTPVNGITSDFTPELDVFIKTNSGKTFFIEAKCHEICDCYNSIELSSSYMKTSVFHKLGLIEECCERVYKDRKGNHHYIALKKYNDDRKHLLFASDFGCELKTYHFDFEQFLRHLMGIFSYAEEHKDEEIYFYYLVYKNELYIQETKSKIYEELEAEIKEVFKVFGNRFPKIHFGLCYHNEYNTLKELKPVDWGN